MNRSLLRPRRHWLTAGLASLIALTPTARADWQSTSLNELIAQSDAVAAGRVVKVSPGAEPGSQVATVRLRNAFKGNPGRTFQLAGAEHDPALPHFVKDRDILAFFDVTPGAPGSVVGRDQGATIVTQTQFTPTAQLIQLVQNKGTAVRLGEVLPLLVAGPPRVPQPVLAALLEQLEGTATRQDAGAIRRLACTPQDYQPQAATLAIHLAGVLAIAEVRGCLERYVRTPASPWALDAVEALGDLADPRSLQPLLALIPSVTPRPFEEGNDAVEEDGPGPDFDPEDDGTPKPDPWEEDDRDPPRPRPEDRVDTGNREPDGDVSDDNDANDGPVPPGEVAENDDAPYDSDDLFDRTADGGLTEAAVLALGKLGDSSAVTRLSSLTREGDNLGLHSTVVVALGLIGTSPAQRELAAIAEGHPNALVRTLARQTLERLNG